MYGKDYSTTHNYSYFSGNHILVLFVAVLLHLFSKVYHRNVTVYAYKVHLHRFEHLLFMIVFCRGRQGDPVPPPLHPPLPSFHPLLGHLSCSGDLLILVCVRHHPLTIEHFDFLITTVPILFKIGMKASLGKRDINCIFLDSCTPGAFGMGQKLPKLTNLKNILLFNRKSERKT